MYGIPSSRGMWLIMGFTCGVVVPVEVCLGLSGDRKVLQALRRPLGQLGFRRVRRMQDHVFHGIDLPSGLSDLTSGL